eukprot:tig00000369_g24606.t2
MCLCPSNCALCDGGRRKNHSCRTTEVYTVHNTSSSRVVLDQAALKAKPEKETEMLGPRTRGRQGLRTPRRAATRRAASSFAPPGFEARPPHAASSGNSASGLELRPARLRGKPPHAASSSRSASGLELPPTGLETRTLHDEPSGSSASGLEIHPARLRDKTAARHVERQLGERHRASPRPASSRARRPASSFPPPGIEARPLQRRAMSRLPVSATGLELPPARDRGKASARRVERQLGEQPRAELRPASRQGLRTPRRAAARRAASSISPPGIEARPLHAASSDSSASSLELRPAQLRRRARQSKGGRGRRATRRRRRHRLANATPTAPLRPFHAFRLPAPADPL